MENVIAEYGILITVRSAKDTYLFLDGIDRDRYMTILIKMLNRSQRGDAIPVIAGLNNDEARILFRNGYEEPLRYLIRMIHTSFASYRKAKNCPVQFGRSSFELLDGTANVVRGIKHIRDHSDYICTVFDSEEANCPPGTLAERIKIIPGKISAIKLLQIASTYCAVSSFEEFLQYATSEQKKEFIKELRSKYELSYREIGKILNCSGTTAHRIVNKSS